MVVFSHFEQLYRKKKIFDRALGWFKMFFYKKNEKWEMPRFKYYLKQSCIGFYKLIKNNLKFYIKIYSNNFVRQEVKNI